MCWFIEIAHDKYSQSFQVLCYSNEASHTIYYCLLLIWCRPCANYTTPNINHTRVVYALCAIYVNHIGHPTSEPHPTFCACTSHAPRWTHELSTYDACAWCLDNHLQLSRVSLPWSSVWATCPSENKKKLQVDTNRKQLGLRPHRHLHRASWQHC